jgi:hypothetical protein
MEFQQAEKRFKQLKDQFEAGALTETDFKAQLENLMVQDEGGSWWMIGYETELWYRHDGKNWIQANPTYSLPLQKKTEHKADEKPADFTKPNIIKSISTNKKLFQTWRGRSLLGGIVGLILGTMIASRYGWAGILIVLVVCGLAGLITYPHKMSIAFLISGFIVAGFMFDPFSGAILGLPAGALLSRILHWIKVLK